MRAEHSEAWFSQSRSNHGVHLMYEGSGPHDPHKEEGEEGEPKSHHTVADFHSDILGAASNIEGQEETKDDCYGDEDQSAQP